ncbi:RHS repeat-associated core domain-containing protein [Snodgrassella alvi]|uniref:RHS repeat-associated core domain-containing protein n=4 Tax=Snodgrassella alvi TaxID=1196083 RepID=UPI000CBC9E1F|nr:RHS repeat-associated core domain-containing protein [Snodgrassella alvi]PIT13065.1 sugar-binding protein [Snodgrassella alvi]PIT20997.1 sugar-binding protein [Snodgrassella alvi]
MIQETGPNHPTSLYIYTDQNSYEPLARIDKRGNDPERVMYFHTDLNGCPEELTDANGELLWECSFQLWGKRIHEIEHESIEQNLRYQGQYLDRETGLHYNTFRYYDPDIGRFTQPDPIGLLGGLNLYQYAPNGLTWVDPLGLTSVNAEGYHVYGLYDPGATKPYYIGITNNVERRRNEHRDTGRLTSGRMEVLEKNVTYGQARGYEQYYIEIHETRTGTIGEEISSTNRGNKYNSFDHNRTDDRAKAFKEAYHSKKGNSMNGRIGKGKC